MARCAFQSPNVVNGVKRGTRNLICPSASPPKCALPPRKIGRVAKDVQEALQAALKGRRSRCKLELPPGARLGTEKRKDAASRGAGNRELCRLIAGMFEKTGLSVHAQFPSPDEAEAARKKWGPLVECTIGSWEGGGGGAVIEAKNKGGFGKKKQTTTKASKASTPIAEDIDVLLVVAPTPGQLGKVRSLSERWGMDKLILLLNCTPQLIRKAPMDVQAYIGSGGEFEGAEFETVYCYRPNPHPKWSGGLLFKKFPDDWILAHTPTPLGIVNTLMEKDEEPTIEEIENALKRESKKPSTGFMNKITGFLQGNE